MKTTFILLLMHLTAMTVFAQDIKYNSKVDEIWGGRVFKELDGKFAGTSMSGSYTTWPSNDRTVMVYCLRVPAGHVRADALITPRSGKTVTFNLRVVRASTGEVITEQTSSFTAASSAEQTVELMSDTQFPKDAWYRFEITSPQGSTTMSRFTKILFQRTSSQTVGDSEIFMAPSVHLNTFATTDPEAPAGESYDWMYQEVMLPPQYEHPNTYAMVIGTDAGYSGIQSTLDNKGGYYHHVIFSVWDNGDTDKDPGMPDYLKSGVVDKGENVIGVRFGGEGTGSSARLTSGYWWEPGKWVQFLWNSRPENVQVTLTGHDGKDSIASYQNTLESCWYKMADETEWHYIATLRESGRNHYYSAFYSFLENFTEAGGELMRRAYFRNASMRSIASGKWYARNSVTFGHTQGGSSRLSRKDYGHGVTSVYDNCFYLQQGGYGEVCDSAMILPLPESTPWADTINIAALTARVDEAIRRDEAAQALARVENARYADMRKWTLLSFSDQETSGEGVNGRAAQAIDGSASTYWHTQWKPSKATYPHWLIMDAGVETTVTGLALQQERESSYRARQVRVYTSDDAKTWRLGKAVTLPNENNPEVGFGTDITSRYFKLEFTSGYGTDLMAINELSFTVPYDLGQTLSTVRSILSSADRLGGYRRSDLGTLIQLYDEGRCTDLEALVDALRALSGCPMLKFGVLKSVQNISTSRCYQLHNITTSSVLSSLPDGSATVAVPDGTENALDSCGNWLILRSEQYRQHYIYNVGTGQYLSSRDGALVLVSSAQPVDIAAAPGGFHIAGTKDVYQILDNYSMAPDASEAYSLLAYSELGPQLGRRLTALCEEALALYGEAFDYTVGRTDYARSAARWSSNVNTTQNGSHPISHICDGSRNTYYETWYSGIVWPEAQSYIQLRLPAAQTAFRFSFTPSQNTSYGLTDMPTAITVHASPDGKEWNQVATLTEDFPARISGTYTSPVISLGGKCSHLRFQVEQTHGNRDGGNHIFAIAEMNVYAATASPATSPYVTHDGVRAAADSLLDQLATCQTAIRQGQPGIHHLAALQTAIDDLRQALQDAATAIVSPIGAQAEGGAEIYNLSGQRIHSPQPGVNIIGRRKVFDGGR